MRVEAGSGDDAVHNLDGNPDSQIAYRSGQGSDRYQGNGGYDDVALTPDGHDRSDTRGGGDYVTVGRSRHVGAPNFELGLGNDTLATTNGGLGGHLDGGPGHDVLSFEHKSSQDWTLDDEHGVATAGGATRFRWSSFEYFELDFLQVEELMFLGSAGSETLFLPNFGPDAVDLRTGAGDDDVQVDALTGGDVDLGRGTDALDLHSSSTGATLTADLGRGPATAASKGPRAPGRRPASGTSRPTTSRTRTCSGTTARTPSTRATTTAVRPTAVGAPTPATPTPRRTASCRDAGIAWPRRPGPRAVLRM